MPADAGQTCLVTGASGFLGTAIADRLPYEVVGVGRQGRGVTALDLRDADAVAAFMDKTQPDAVVHCAAYRDPDFCEREPGEARRLNTRAVAHLLDGLPAAGRFLFISTDYVFDGTHPPYCEDDPVSPVNVYGASKAEAEGLVREHPGGMVLRVPLLCGAGPSWEESGFIFQLAGDMDASGGVRKLDDRAVRFPTWIEEVAGAVEFLLAQDQRGIFHYSGLEGMTRYQWALALAQHLEKDAGHISPLAKGIPRAARRPVNSQLDSSRIRALGYDPRSSFFEVFKRVQGDFL
jgi:dTDP-4-dehydrorhamnose reductase